MEISRRARDGKAAYGLQMSRSSDVPIYGDGDSAWEEASAKED